MRGPNRRILFNRKHRRHLALLRGSRSARQRTVFGTVFTVLLLALACITTGTAVAAAITGFGVIYTYQSVTQDLPSVSEVGNAHLAETSIIYDRNGVELYKLIDPDTGWRQSVALNDMTPDLIWATVATENPTFYEDPGVDVSSIARATLQDLRSGTAVSGASTITQQLIKRTVLSSQTTITRKMREAILAYRLTKVVPKDKILELYLNQIYYGNNTYGVEAASEEYFNTSAKNLTLAQASFLAGLPQAPSFYDPFANYPAAKRRQGEVLGYMVREQLISQDQANQAAAADIQLVDPHARQTILRAPHFVFYVIDQLVQQFGHDLVYQGGLRITTTLDYGLQQAGQQIVTDQVSKIKTDHHATDGSLVAINPKTGEIVAMVGSANYNDASINGQVNIATALRQPGSTVKPFTYAAAFERGYSPASIVVDAKTQFPINQQQLNGTWRPSAVSDPATDPYAPCNYDNQAPGCPPQYFHGPISMRRALGNSLNVPAVKTLEYAGIDSMVSLARAMGITTWTQPAGSYGLSVTLGGSEVRLLDLTSAYGVFAAQGVRHPPIAWRDIRDIYGHVYSHFDDAHPDPGARILSPQVSFLITDVLSDDSARALEFGTGSGLVLSRPAAAKTGTTDSFRDNWTVGYTPNLVTGVWVGNADNTPMKDVIGITGAGPIWHDFMESALRPIPVEQFLPPAGLVQERVSNLTGLIPVQPTGTEKIVYTKLPNVDKYVGNYVTTGEPSHVDWFIAGSEPTRSTYRLGTYEALWTTGQPAINCPAYMVDVRVFGPQLPPPGVYDCAAGKQVDANGLDGYNGTPPTRTPTPSPTATSTPVIPTRTPTPTRTATPVGTPPAASPVPDTPTPTPTKRK